MKPSRPQPHVRVIIGRNITLTAAAIYCLTRAWAYLPHTYPQGATAIDLISIGGAITWAWAATWAVAGIVCVIDMINRHTRYGLSLMVALMAAWGTTYLVAWGITGFMSRDWLTGISYLGPSVIVFGFLLKITALQDMLNPAAAKEGEAP